MSPESVRFSGSVPEHYDTYLGPLLFEPYAEELVRRFQPHPGQSVLEVACGTGRVTRHLLDKLPPGSRLVATDLFEPMLDRARTIGPADERLRWQSADACDLPFGDAEFDWLFCQFGLMFVPDKARAMSEAMRVLAPGGRFVFNTWDRLEYNELSNLAHRAMNTLYPSDPITFFEVPFSLHRVDELRQWLQESGFVGIEIESVRAIGTAPSPRAAALGLIRGTPVAGAIEERGTVDIDRVVDVVEAAIVARAGSGEVKGKMRALVATARKP